MRMPRLSPWLLVVTLTAAGAAAAVGYGLTAPKQYRATAAVLVAPVSAVDPTFAGLGLLRDSSGRRTGAESAAALVKTPQVADAVRAQLGVRRSSTSLLDAIGTKVSGGSDVVLVTGHEGSAVGAAQLANAFVDALIAQRTASFQSQLASAIRRDTQLLAQGKGAGAGAQAVELARRLAVLRSFQGQPDPTLRRASTAIAPTSPAGPKVWALAPAGAGAGLGAAALLLLVLLLLKATRGGRVYDRPVVSERSERAAEKLVDRLERRLAARESALAARQQDLQAKIDELVALEARVNAGAPAAVDLAPREEAPREVALDEREAELAQRERLLAERVATVTKRELAVARATAAAAAAEIAPAPVAPPAPAEEATVEERPAAVSGRGGYNLTELEKLVDRQRDEYPARVDEWSSYLYFLRDYAEADGTIPSTFDALIVDTFAELVG